MTTPTPQTARVATPGEYPRCRQLIREAREGGLNDEEIREFLIAAALMVPQRRDGEPT